MKVTHSINEPRECNVVPKKNAIDTQMIPFIFISCIQKYTKSNNIFLERQAYMIKLSRKAEG